MKLQAPPLRELRIRSALRSGHINRRERERERERGEGWREGKKEVRSRDVVAAESYAYLFTSPLDSLRIIGESSYTRQFRRNADVAR